MPGGSVYKRDIQLTSIQYQRNPALNVYHFNLTFCLNTTLLRLL
jgi:hypothetical protein